MRRDYAILVGLLAAVFLLPAFDRNIYHLQIVAVVGLFYIAALGLNLLMGYAGQVSLGQASFMGVGAYVSMILTHKRGYLQQWLGGGFETAVAWLSGQSWAPGGLARGLAGAGAVLVGGADRLNQFAIGHLYIAPLIAAAVAGLIALGVGAVGLKLRGHYLAMATLGMGIIIVKVFEAEQTLTGGRSGVYGIPKLWIFGPPADPSNYKLFLYYLIWALAGVLVIFAIHLVHSRLGRALRAIHSDELAAAASGVPVMRLKLLVFVIGAVYASLAGSIYAHLDGFIDPPMFGFMESVTLLIMVTVGGAGSIWGALLGVALLHTLPQVLTWAKDYEMAVFGLILIVAMIVAPKGLAGLLDRAWRAVWKPRP